MVNKKRVHTNMFVHTWIPTATPIFSGSSYPITNIRFLDFHIRFLPSFFPFDLAISPLLLDSWIPKTLVLPLEFRCYLEYTLSYTYLRFRGRHLGFSTFGYLLTSDYYQYNTRGMSVAELVGVAVGSLFTTSVLHVTGCSLFVFTTSGSEPPYCPSGGY